MAKKEAHSGIELKMITASDAGTNSCPANCNAVLTTDTKIPAHMTMAKLMAINMGVAPANADAILGSPARKRPLVATKKPMANRACVDTFSATSGPCFALGLWILERRTKAALTTAVRSSRPSPFHVKGLMAESKLSRPTPDRANKEARQTLKPKEDSRRVAKAAMGTMTVES